MYHDDCKKGEKGCCDWLGYAGTSDGFGKDSVKLLYDQMSQSVGETGKIVNLTFGAENFLVRCFGQGQMLNECVCIEY